MVATVIETKELLETVIAATVAGVGITFLFSVMVFAAVRFEDLRRDERPLAAAAAGGLATAALIATTAGIVLALIVMLSK